MNPLTLSLALLLASPDPVAALAPPSRPTLTLEAALAHARGHSLELRIAEERLAQVRTLTRKAWALHLPQLSAGAVASRNSEDVVLELPTAFAIRNFGVPTSAPRANLPPYDPSKPFSDANLPGESSTYALIPTRTEELEVQREVQYGVQAQVSQALVAPQLWYAIGNAARAARVAERGVEAARADLLFGVAQLYVGAATLKESAAVQERVLSTWRRNEADAERLVAEGAAPRLALLKARTDRARAEQELLRALDAYAAARQALATLLDRDDAFDVERPPELAAPGGDAKTLSDEAAANRPEVLQAQAALELARGQRAQAAAKYLPVVGLTGTWRWASVTGFTGEHDAWTLGLGLSWNLLDGGLREAELSEASHRAAEAEAARALAANRARDEVKRALLDLDSARAARRKAEEQQSLAREALEQARNAYAAGVATYLDVADATRAEEGASLSVVAESLGQQLAGIRLARAAGAFGR